MLAAVQSILIGMPPEPCLQWGKSPRSKGPIICASSSGQPKSSAGLLNTPFYHAGKARASRLTALRHATPWEKSPSGLMSDDVSSSRAHLCSTTLFARCLRKSGLSSAPANTEGDTTGRLCALFPVESLP
ncbi:hypothetical protein SCLCIDRAFT_506417 [Scleroderma citrinum Foug A]|uniref:Uncharacterized protein n=1 Tax=Scleroderma citrinum Foug A TaxID=1036808 RepID=A0A0C3AYS1_9AGAM|nr:hypothetical protein SCLCIDRAFT_506417 [Scleroderma citrinum Foug A]